MEFARFLPIMQQREGCHLLVLFDLKFDFRGMRARTDELEYAVLPFDWSGL
jgi:hypothetical protein